MLELEDLFLVEELMLLVPPQGMVLDQNKLLLTSWFWQMEDLQLLTKTL